MTLYLPDTNIFIYAYNGEKPFTSHLSSWITENRILISAIVVAEFLSSGEKSERDTFNTLIDHFGTIPIDTSIAKIAADYKRNFFKMKPKLKLPDALIAATAKFYGAILITSDKKDFPMTDIEKLQL